MDGDTNDQSGLSLSLPIGVIATGLLLTVAATIAYVIVNRQDESAGGTGGRARFARGGLFRRAGLMTFIALIENDATRRLLVTVLRAIARRS